ncbi:MAG: GNAT family N-acetyltransferase, partial [Proteobacteria bacterium]
MTGAEKSQIISINRTDFVVKNFAALSSLELKQIYQLRQQVFIVEQNCPYPDIDDEDLVAWHVFYPEKQALCAYARVLNSDRGNWYIGRVVVAQDKRHQGLGQAVMKAALEFCHITMPRQTIIISAQSYLAQFY